MSYVGEKVARVEDRRILTGRGRYIDDLRLPRMVHAAFLRSPLAHARIEGVDTAEAVAAPGVVAVLTGEEMASLIKPMPIGLAGAAAPVHHPLVTDRVRYVGDLVAVVLAETRAQAEDAAELIEVDYDPLPAVATYAAALDAGGPPLFDDIDTNVLVDEENTHGDVDAAFAAADRVIDLTLRQDRVSPMPMETRGAIADFDPAGGDLTLHVNTQTASALRLGLTMSLDLPMERVRVVVPADVGGAFGLKSSWGREVFCVAAASRKLGRPVKWTEDRYEHLLSSGQAREEQVGLSVAVKDDGTLLGLKADLMIDQGAYPAVPYGVSVLLGLVQTLLPGPYRWQGYAFRRRVLLTNKATYVAYRGPWEVECWARERMIEEVARRLGLDPADVRRRNLAAGDPDDRLVTGLTLAGHTGRAQHERVLAQVGYEDFRKEQAAARAEGRYLGIGVATFIEPAPGPPDSRAATGAFKAESANVRLESDGHLVVVTAQVSQGQSHQTTLAQVAADEMGIPFEHVRVEQGDSRTAPFKFTGTGGSMSSTWASGAVLVSTRRVKEKVLAIAAAQLEMDVADLDVTDGMVVPRGAPAKAVPLAQIAMQAAMMPDFLPPGTDHRLQAEERFTGQGITGSGWTGATHACTVEVDLETGRVRILRYCVVEDCGRVINPAVVEGQIRGGVAQGIGEVLYEKAAYDEDGNPLASTFMDYLVPTSAEVPAIEIEHLESDPDGEFGFRGVGEGGAIVSPATLGNAIADALAPLGAVVTEQYLPPARILELAGIIATDP